MEHEPKTFDKLVINKGFGDINPILCGAENCDKKNFFGPASRSYWLLHFVISGKGTFVTPRGRTAVKKNDIFVIRPYEITYYEADETDPWKYIWIGFFAGIRLPSLLTTSDVIYAPSLMRTFEQCLSAPDSSSGTEGYEELLCSAVWNIISFARQNEHSHDEEYSHYIKPALDIMEAEYCNGISVAEIAARLHLNRSYFSMIFRKNMKKTVAEHLSELRMERAAKLLTEYGYSVTVTAASVGYQDVFTFSRAFKKRFGVSPSEYRSD